MNQHESGEEQGWGQTSFQENVEMKITSKKCQHQI
jgi:hypothetical protein